MLGPPRQLYDRLPGSVTASGSIAIAGSVLLGLFTLLMALAAQHLSGANQGGGNPDYATPFFRAILSLSLLFSAYGLLTGICLLLRQNWARLSCLAWSAATLGSVLVLLPNFYLRADSGKSGFLALVLISPVFILTGSLNFWWLDLFQRDDIVFFFGGTERAPWKCALPLAVLGGYFMSAFILSLAALTVKASTPIMFFGSAQFGPLFRLSILALSAVTAGAGLAIWRDLRSGFLLGLIMQVFWVADSAVTVFSPRSLQNFQSALALMANLGYPHPRSGAATRMHKNYEVGLLLAVFLECVLIYFYWKASELPRNESLGPSTQSF